MKLCTYISDSERPYVDLKHGSYQVLFYDLDTGISGTEVLPRGTAEDYFGYKNGILYRVTFEEYQLYKLLELESYPRYHSHTDFMGGMLHSNILGKSTFNPNTLFGVNDCPHASIMSYIFYLNRVGCSGRYFRLYDNLLEVICYSRLYRFKLKDVGAFVKLFYM